MRPARWVAISGAVVSFVFLIAGVPQAQPPTPTTPSIPAPQTPAAPPGTPSVPAPSEPTRDKPAKTDEEREPVRPGETEIRRERAPEELLPSPSRTFIGPDLFNPPAHQGFITVTPSFTLSGEYNDNIFLASENTRSDGIFNFTPGVTLSMQRPGFRLLSGYNTTASLYARESDLNGFGQEHQFFTDLFYQPTPRLTVSVTDQFFYGRNTNALTSGGVSVGREESWRNTLTPSLRWQATPTTAIGLLTSYTIVRFVSDDVGDNSDTYRIRPSVDRELTKRLSGSLSTEVAYIDIEGEKPAWTFTPMLGFAYDITPTLRVSANAGPTIATRSGDTGVSPAVAAQLTRTFKFGQLLVGYDRAITAETIGASDRQAVFASLIVPTLLRGLQISFLPRYAIVDTDVSRNSGSGSSETFKTLTLELNAIYQIARNINLIGSYTYFQQRSDRSSSGDLDQNRVFLGVQYTFPITLY